MSSSPRSEFLAGALDMAPVVAAALPIGTLFGAIAVQKGLTPMEALAMSGLVFGGAAQFVALDIWPDPAPVALLTFTALIVNLRHVMMGASLGRHMGLFSPANRAASAFVLVDEVWAFAERRVLKGPLTPAYYWGMGSVLWLQWVAGCGIGALAGQSLGDPARFGFDFAFTALFLVIVTGFWRGQRTAAVLAAAAVVSALVKLYVPGAWNIALGGIAGITAAALLADGEEGVR
jgi:4-azaleucine resistance transporter AzlC